MGIEIERKFLVIGEDWKPHVIARKRLRQAYLTRSGKASIRVRIVDDAEAALTIKSQGARASRLEFEYPIPVNDAQFLLDMREGHLLSKVRHLVRHDGLTWEVDVFESENAGLVIAEIELEHEHQDFSRPPWVGREVTREPRYSNSRLALQPFSSFAADGLHDAAF
jgi:adenylate cyclase